MSVFEFHFYYLYAFLKGEIDHHTAPNIREAIDDALSSSESAKTLVLDFGDVSFMDSSGIGVVIGRCKTMRFRSGRVMVSNLSDRMGKLFQATGENIDMSNPIFLWSCFSPCLFDLLPQLIGVDISDS